MGNLREQTGHPAELTQLECWPDTDWRIIGKLFATLQAPGLDSLGGVFCMFPH